MQVIRKQTHYSVIFMRDDAEVTIFRMKNTVLKILVWLLVILVLLGCGGIAAGILVGKSYLRLSKKYKDAERQVVESKLQLERLYSLQAFLQASSNSTIPASRVKNEEIVPVAVNNGPAGSNGQTAANGRQSAVTQTAASTAHPANATLAGVSETAESGNGRARGTAETPASAEEPPLISSDECPVRVENLNLRVAGQLRLRVRYDIVSAQELTQQLAGRVSYAVTLEDGRRIEAKAQNYGETRFAILRMKQMENTLQIPAGLNINARMVNAVEITVETEDGSRQFREVFPMPES